MGVSPNWNGTSLQKMHDDINGGAGYQTTAASATMWSGVATQLEDVADRVRSLTQAGTDWQGAGADAMTASHDQFDTWAQDARDLSARATQAANNQASLFTDTRPKIEAPGDTSQHQDNIFQKGASYLPGVTTDQEAFEKAEADKQKAAAAAMSSYETSVSSDAGRGYFSTPPVLAVSVGAAPVSPASVPVPAPNDPGTPWTTPQTRVRSVDTQGLPTGHLQSESLASSPASVSPASVSAASVSPGTVSAASWQTPAGASGSTTAPNSLGHTATGQPTVGPSGTGSAPVSSGGAPTTPGGGPTAGVSSQSWSDPARTGASSSTGGGAGVTGGAGGYGGSSGAGAGGSNRSRGGGSAGGATQGSSSVAPVVGGGFAAGSGLAGGGGGSGATGSRALDSGVGGGSTTGAGGPA